MSDEVVALRNSRIPAQEEGTSEAAMNERNFRRWAEDSGDGRIRDFGMRGDDTTIHTTKYFGYYYVFT